MGNTCDHHTWRQGCALAWVREDDDGNIVEWDTENYGISETGECLVDDDEFPGDGCAHYQPSLSGDYCDRCGNYLGYGDEEDEDNYEESECICDD